MGKRNRFYSLLFLALGGIIAIGSGILLFLHIKKASTPMGITALVLSVIGGLLLAVLSMKTVTSPTGGDSTPSFLKKPITTGRLTSLWILSLAAVIFFIAYGEARATPAIPQSTVQAGIAYEKAEVLQITRNDFQQQQDFEDIPIGKQYLTVELTSGDYAGQRFTDVVNNLSYLYGTVVKEGDSVTLAVVYENGKVTDLVLQDFDRTSPLMIVLALFLVITVLVGGKVGAKSLLGLSLTILCTFSVLIPLLIGGAPTIPAILGMCAYVTIVEFVILDGVNKKTVCAILGTISGVVIAAVFGKLACEILRINGYKTYEVDSTIEALLQLKQGQTLERSLQLGDLLVGGILIAALGAVNDVAMSISSAMNELITVNPNLTRKELLKSGMAIGRDMVGTMTNTLILAFVGSGLVMMIYLVSLEPSFQQLMSTGYLSVEVVQGVASSIGVILAVPLSVVIGTLLYGSQKGNWISASAKSKEKSR